MNPPREAESFECPVSAQPLRRGHSVESATATRFYSAQLAALFFHRGRRPGVAGQRNW